MSRDRRQQPDRRILPTRNLHGGRRSTDTDPSHGTRARYQRGCPCESCTAANTAYEQAYRKDKAKGHPRLRSLVSAQDAARRIRELKAEGMLSEEAIARALGYKQPRLKVSIGVGAKMTLRNALKIKRLHRTLLRLDDESASPSL